jgi:hypothetical protein
MPNPHYFDYEQFPKDLKAAQHDPRGFSLIAWWIHPELQKGSRYFTADAVGASSGGMLVTAPLLHRQESATSDFSARQHPADLSSGTSYLYSVECFKASHLAELTVLDAAVRAHMSRVYGIERLDDGELYFHTAARKNRCARKQWCSTVHLHIGHRRVRSPSCHDISHSLTSVSRQLASTGQFDGYGRWLWPDPEGDHPCAIEMATISGFYDSGHFPTENRGH